MRSIDISIFVMCVSFGMAMMNAMNDTWEASEGLKFIDYGKTPPINYSDIADTSGGGVKSKYANLTSYEKPSSVENDYGFFYTIKAVNVVIDTFFNCVWGIPAFLEEFGMPGFFVPPLAVMLVVNHMITLVYLVRGLNVV